MAAINSPFRDILKPILFKFFGKSLYIWFHYKAKIRDINQRLVDDKETELLPHFVKPTSTVIDIGANYAYYTILMSRLAAKVYAFEPIPFSYKVMRQIVRHFEANNVTTVPKGVAHVNDTLTYSVPKVEYGAFSASQAHLNSRNNKLEGIEKYYAFSQSEQVQAPVVRLDNELADIDKLDFVKMDLEGAEYFALQGMTNLIDKFKPVILLEINPAFMKGYQIDETDLKTYIEKVGYDTFIYDENLKKLKAYRGNYTESNYLLIPEAKKFDYEYLIEK